MLKKILFIILLSSFIFSNTASVSAKTEQENPRLLNLSQADKEKFESLSKTQQKNIRNQKVEEGYNEWMVLLALGEPRFRSVQHPKYQKHEEVWLYTKDKVTTNSTSRHFVNPKNNWPSVEKTTVTKTCKVGDFFLMYDRGVVTGIAKADPKKTYGNCQVHTVKDVIPVVNKKIQKIIKSQSKE